MSLLLSATRGIVKRLEISMQALDRGVEGPERIPMVGRGQEQSLHLLQSLSLIPS